MESSLNSLGADQTENTASSSFYIVVMALRSYSLDIVGVFTCRYQAMNVPSRYRCIATVLHATISYNIPKSEMMCLKVSVVSKTFKMDLILVMLCLFHCFLKFVLSAEFFFLR
jgi:hypothetical protein